jgi:hypothetical protein
MIEMHVARMKYFRNSLFDYLSIRIMFKTTKDATFLTDEILPSVLSLFLAMY